MFTAHPLDCFSVRTPYTVVSLMLVNDVQVELFQSEQPPLDDQVIPAALKIAAACECVILVTADASTVGSRPATTTAAATKIRSTTFMGTLLEIGAVISKSAMPKKVIYQTLCESEIHIRALVEGVGRVGDGPDRNDHVATTLAGRERAGVREVVRRAATEGLDQERRQLERRAGQRGVLVP